MNSPKSTSKEISLAIRGYGMLAEVCFTLNHKCVSYTVLFLGHCFEFVFESDVTTVKFHNDMHMVS